MSYGDAIDRADAAPLMPEQTTGRPAGHTHATPPANVTTHLVATHNRKAARLPNGTAARHALHVGQHGGDITKPVADPLGNRMRSGRSGKATQ